MTRTWGDLSPREVCDVWRASFQQQKKVLAPHLPVVLASAELQRRERTVLELYAGEGLKLREVGASLKGGEVGVSESYVSKLFSRVCEKLCAQLATHRPDTVVALGFRGDVIASLVEHGVYTSAQLSQMTVRDILELVERAPDSPTH